MKAARTPRDFWFWTTLCIAGLFAIFLVYPLFSLFASSFVDPDGGGFTLARVTSPPDRRSPPEPTPR